ncbi:radical SAM protein [Candidatus Sumerlaeota bacterium]|nr:radical SAM protein [Candidatus Sumerlaeota bacterium]
MGIPVKLSKYLNDRRSLGDKLYGRSRVKAMPKNIHLEINDQCNLNCFMCPRNCEMIPKDTGWLDPAIIDRISGSFRTASYVGLAGNGEPFLHPHLHDILKTICRYGSVPSIVTNGTLLTEEWIRRLIELGPSILTVSFDGGTKETFETIRTGARFDQVIDSLRLLSRLKQEKDVPFPVLNFLVCVMKENKDELVSIMEWAKELGAPKVIFQSIFPFTERARQSMIEDLRSIEELSLPAKEYGRKNGIEVILSPLSFGIHKRLQVQNKRLAPGAPLFCENIWQTLHVGLNGDVRFCCFWLGDPIGNLRDKSVEELWNHLEFQKLRAQIFRGDIPENCLNCHILEVHDPERINVKCRIKN